MQFLHSYKLNIIVSKQMLFLVVSVCVVFTFNSLKREVMTLLWSQPFEAVPTTLTVDCHFALLSRVHLTFDVITIVAVWMRLCIYSQCCMV